MFILHPEPQLKTSHYESQLKECHVFTLYPEPQFKGYDSEPQLKEWSNKSIFKVSPKALSTMHIQCIQTFCPCIIAWRYSRAAKRNPIVDRLAEATYHQAPHAPEPSDFASIAWWDEPHCQALGVLVAP